MYGWKVSTFFHPTNNLINSESYVLTLPTLGVSNIKKYTFKNINELVHFKLARTKIYINYFKIRKINTFFLLIETSVGKLNSSSKNAIYTYSNK